MVLKRGAALSLALGLLSSTLAADLPKVETSEGVVHLTRAEYDRLRDAAEAAEEAAGAAPRKTAVQSPPAIDSALLELSASAERTVLDVTLDVTVKPPGSDARITWPLSGSGFLDLLTEKGPLPVAIASDGRTFVFRRPGRYRLTARTVLRDAARGRTDHRLFQLQAPPAASVRLIARSTLAGSELALGDEPLAAGVARPVPAGAPLTVTMKLPARLPETAEKAVVVAEVVDVVRLERDRVARRTVLRISVSRAEIADLPVVLPRESEWIETTGPEEPRLETADGRSTLVFTKPWKGDRTYSIRTSSPRRTEAPLDLVPTTVPGAASSRGYLLVTSSPLYDVKPARLEGLARTDAADLPVFARPFADGATRAYRVASPASARATFTAVRRTVVAPPDTLLTEASLLTVFGDGQTRLDRRRFTVETKRTFFEMPLDAAEEVLSVSVDGAPVAPHGEEGTLVVFLPPSASASRVIEVDAKRKDAGPPASGDFGVAQAALPAAASVVSWTIVLPDDRRYRFVASSGIQKAGWSADAPAMVTRSDVKPASWMASPAPKGELNLQVADRDGTPLPGVSIQLKDARSGVTRAGVTDSDGKARFWNLPDSDYVVESSLAGFGRSERRVPLRGGAGANVNETLKLSSVAETITVTADTPMIDMSRSEQSYRADDVRKQLDRMTKESLPAGRDSQTIVGGMANQNTFVVDGVSTTQSTAGVWSLPVAITGRGKRLTLSGPLVGAAPLSVSLAVKRR